MKYLLILAFLLIGCGDGADSTVINFAQDGSQSGDPVTEAPCRESDDGCQQDVQ